MPEPYWAAITTLIVMQSNLKSTLALSVRRLIGTAMGVTLGALLFKCFGSAIPIFGLGVLVAGLACMAIGRVASKFSDYVDRTAYRYAGVALAIVLLIPHSFGIWKIAMDRFIEVSVGILVALAITKFWPEASELTN